MDQIWGARQAHVGVSWRADPLQTLPRAFLPSLYASHLFGSRVGFLLAALGPKAAAQQHWGCLDIGLEAPHLDVTRPSSIYPMAEGLV